MWTRVWFVSCVCLLLLVSIDGGKRRGSLKRRPSSDEDCEPRSCAKGTVLDDNERRMGLRQRSAGNVECDEASQVPLARELLEQWAKGALSSPNLHKLAVAAAKRDPAMQRLAGIGGGGSSPQNFQRDLLSFFGSPPGAPPVTWIELPTTVGRSTPHPVLMPHLFFQSVFAKRKDVWHERLLGPRGACKQFWREMQGSDFLRLHPFMPMGAWSKTIPLGFHGDGGSFNENDSLYALNWNSLVVGGPTIQTRFLFSVVRKSECVGDTIDELLRVFSWSMNVVLSGQTPHVDWKNRAVAGGGKDLCGGYRGCCCQCRGDWEWYVKIFYFGRWDEAERMCPFCRASVTNRHLGWYNFDMDAPWRDTIWTHEAYISFLKGRGLPFPILFRAGIGILGLRLENVMVDVLHTVDQGIGSHIIANVIFIFIVLRNCLGGSTYAERMKRGHAHLMAWYKEHRVTNKIRGALTLEKVRKTGEWPKLRTKAAPTRCMARYALHLVLEFGKCVGVDAWVKLHDELAMGVTQSLVRFYTILEGQSQFLTEAVKSELPELCQNLASMYCQLSAMTFAREHKLWKITPKLHLWLHLAHQATTLGNPRYWWTYGDEDLIGQLIEQSSGLHPKSLPGVLLVKWLLLVFNEVLVDLD